MSATKILQFFATRRERRDPLVLATVFETQGSTYSKAGAQMLIDRDGIFQGMLSGGCLEGDLAIRAQIVLDSGLPQLVTYDLGQNDDDVWGLGVGCDGLMRILLQTIAAESDYQPFASISKVLQGADDCVVATVIRSSSETIKVGTAIVFDRNSEGSAVPSDVLASAVEAEASLVLGEKVSRSITLTVGATEIDVLLARFESPPKVLILGAGQDAEPVVRFAAELGWHCTIVDHRQAYIDNGDFASATAKRQIPVSELAATLDIAAFDMALIMSHHLESDRNYLRQLAATDVQYIGLLGPPGRRERLLSELEDVAEQLISRLHGPAGIDIGGRGPAPIALSIVAEMQLHLRADR